MLDAPLRASELLLYCLVYCKRFNVLLFLRPSSRGQPCEVTPLSRTGKMFNLR